MRLPERPRAVITGAGSGLGRALCLELAQRQGRLLVSDVNEAEARETVRRVGLAGGEAWAVACDVTRPEQVDALASECERVLGGVDLVVNNAGVAVAGEVGKLPLGEWKRVLDVNLWGVIHGCHSFVPLLRRQGSGHVLNISSAAGLLSAPFMAPYNASKAAVVSLSETLLAELRPAGIGVSVVCPTFFRTNIAAAWHAEPDEEGQRLRALAAMLVDRSPVGPDEIARACVRGVEEDAFYVVPMSAGRWLWRIKRLAPEGIAQGGRLLEKLLRARVGGDRRG
jgi:NAD(P)-dependent dehydrogenase (short-subunit alcohol dehydrogenase family)